MKGAVIKSPRYMAFYFMICCRYFGCGPVIPEAVEGCDVLDLGSGSGRDCYALSKLVGPTGRVVGIDMTDEQVRTVRF